MLRFAVNISVLNISHLYFRESTYTHCLSVLRRQIDAFYENEGTCGRFPQTEGACLRNQSHCCPRTEGREYCIHTRHKA